MQTDAVSSVVSSSADSSGRCGSSHWRATVCAESSWRSKTLGHTSRISGSGTAPGTSSGAPARKVPPSPGRCGAAAGACVGAAGACASDARARSQPSLASAAPRLLPPSAPRLTRVTRWPTHRSSRIGSLRGAPMRASNGTVALVLAQPHLAAHRTLEQPFERRRREALKWHGLAAAA